MTREFKEYTMSEKYKQNCERQVAIVLQHLGRNITLFERTEKRIDGITYSKKISRGTFISYQTLFAHGKVIIEDIKTEYTPLDQARFDIYFLHALLEVCYYFIPIGSAEFQIYPFLINIMRSFDDISSVRIQKGLICKILAHLGVYPINSHLALPLEDFINIPIDNVVMGNLELAHEDFFDRWLTWCLTTHPQGKKCKALTLLLQK